MNEYISKQKHVFHIDLMILMEQHGPKSGGRSVGYDQYTICFVHLSSSKCVT